MPRPCQKDYRCLWGKVESDRVVCSLPRCCIKTIGPGKYEDTMLPKMMNHDSYERRGGSVKQTRHAESDEE